MRINEILKINEEGVPVESVFLTLSQHSAGCAFFVVQSDKPLSGKAEFYLGYGSNYQLYFSGVIQDSIQIDNKQQRLSIKGFDSILSYKTRLSLRHVTAADILAAIADQTGINFVLQEADWNNQLIPHFFNLGSGYEALDVLGNELDLEKFIWLNNPHGSIYVGSHEGLKHAVDINLPAKFLSQMSAIGASVQMHPGIRPGVRIKVGDSDDFVYITAVDYSNQSMRIKWDKNPFNSNIKRKGYA